MGNRTVPISERSAISRYVVSWLNTYPDLPVDRIDYEFVSEYGMSVSNIQAPFRVHSYIDGCYQAQYQANVIYRDIPTTNDDRLKMDEELNALAIWAESNKPDLGDYIPIKVECPDTSALTARYENGIEDHQITINIFYEVKK